MTDTKTNPEYPLQDWPNMEARALIFSVIRPDEDYKYVRPGWMDHPSIETSSDDQAVYVSHPYSLSGEALRDFARLEENGWRVTIDAYSRYFPGNTVRVSIRRRDTTQLSSVEVEWDFLRGELHDGPKTFPELRVLRTGDFFHPSWTEEDVARLCATHRRLEYALRDLVESGEVIETAEIRDGEYVFQINEEGEGQ